MSSYNLKALKDEKMNQLNKDSIMNETQVFNDSILNDKNSTIILAKLIYLLNQGIEFNDTEIETLFFRITKLFQVNNPVLRCLTYKLLKMIMPQKYVHIILQSVVKDIQGEQSVIKIQALKFVPQICDEQNLQQIEGFIFDALQDPNFIISDTALLVGIKIVNKFPNSLIRWLFDVIEKLDQQKQNQQFHALILLYEMKKANLVYFLRIIIQLLNQELLPLTHLQIIRIIKQVLPQVENSYKQDLIQYLFKQTRNKEPLTFFESFKLLLNNMEITNDDLVTINQQIESQIKAQLSNVQMFCITNLIFGIIKVRKSFLTKQLIKFIKGLAFSVNSKQQALGLLFNFKIKKTSLDICLSKMFRKQETIINKLHLLQGVQKIIRSNSYINQVLEFLILVSYILEDVKLIQYSIKIVEDILTISDEYKSQAIRILRILAIKEQLKNNTKVIRLIISLLLDIEVTISDYKVRKWFNYMNDSNFIYIDQVKLQKLKNYYAYLERSFFITSNYLERYICLQLFQLNFSKNYLLSYHNIFNQLCRFTSTVYLFDSNLGYLRSVVQMQKPNSNHS